MPNAERKMCTLNINDPVLAKLGANMAIGKENSLLVFPLDQRKISIHNLKNEGLGFGRLHEIEWNNLLHNPITRKLLNESHGIFVALQKALEEVDNDQNRREVIISTSRKYRSVVSVCHSNLQNAVDLSSNDEMRVQYSAQSELFYSIEVIWSLVEILFLDLSAGDFVLPRLLDWVSWHSNEVPSRVTEAMSFETITTQPVYWEAVYCFLLQGNIDNTRKLLKRNQDANRDDFLSMDELLRKMPIYKAGRSVSEFNLHWKHWQEECSWRLESGEFSSLAQLEVLAKILCGDRATICELSHLCGTWYHTMVSWLLFTNPCIKGNDLADVARECWDWFKESDVMSDFDQILMSVFSFELSQFSIQLCYFPDSWWFIAHLSDLLFHNKKLKFEPGHSSENPSTLREFLLLNFASSMMSHSSLWQIGVDYLDACGETGRNTLECYLERIYLSSHSKALRVLHLAEKREMKSLVHSICMVMAKQASSNNQIGSALTWAIRAGDFTYVSHLADRFLREYCDNGQFSNLDLLDSLGSSMLISERLTFLGKYREFHRLYEDKKYKTAADLLISLLASNLAPKYFWMTLLLDSIPLLEAEKLVFSSLQTHQLLYSLQELNPPVNERIQMLRLSLARNLAKAFIQESSIN